MGKRYTLLIIDDSGSRVREALFSRRACWLAAAVVIVTLAVMIAGGWHFAQMRSLATGKDRLETMAMQQMLRIEDQRRQIQAFAENINAIKNSLLALNEFEQKVRILANLESRPEQPPFFSIGGSMAEDLDADITLQEDHGRLMRAMHQQLNQVQQAAAVQLDSFAELMDGLKDKRSLLAATPSLRPAKGWISSSFGYRVSPFTGRREMHRGLDIANHTGTPIIAPADGVVTQAEKQWVMGNMIAIDHGYGMVTRYGHLNKILVKKGERVQRGQEIALMGNTGRSTGPHLHYEVRLNGVPVNPQKYIMD